MTLIGFELTTSGFELVGFCFSQTVSLNVRAKRFFLAFFCRPTDPTLVNHIDDKHKNKCGWPNKENKASMHKLFLFIAGVVERSKKWGGGGGGGWG